MLPMANTDPVALTLNPCSVYVSPTRKSLNPKVLFVLAGCTGMIALLPVKFPPVEYCNFSVLDLGFLPFILIVGE